MSSWMIVIPLMSAFTGWLTIRVFAWFLFHPVRPVNIAGLSLQGILPKSQPALAAKLGATVSHELFSFGDLQKKITDPANIQKVMPHVESHIDHFLRVKLKEVLPMISMFIGDKTINELKTVFMKELEILFPEVMNNYMENLQKDLNLEQTVTDKVNAFSISALEQGFKKTFGPKIQLAGLAAAVLGLVIGLLQVGYLLLTLA